MDTAKLYVDNSKNMIDMQSMVSAAKVLVALADNQDDITFSGDEHGHYFEVPADLADRFLAAVGSDDETEEEAEPEAAPRKRGRPRKVAEPEVVAAPSNDSEPDPEE
jgi:hypothetical protein